MHQEFKVKHSFTKLTHLLYVCFCELHSTSFRFFDDINDLEQLILDN